MTLRAIVATNGGSGGGFFPLLPEANCATTANLAATYYNGVSDDGVGATLTLNATGTLTIDGVLTSLGQTILVKDQTSQFQNGTYTVTTEGAVGVNAILTRSTNFNSSSTIQQYASIHVISGTTNSDTSWYESAPPPFIVGTSSIIFTDYTFGVSNITTDTPSSLNISPSTGNVVIGTTQGIGTSDSPTFNFGQYSSSPAVVAAGTNRATATALTTKINNVITVDPGTGVILPTGVDGREVNVFNSSANALKLYALGSDTINDTAGITGITLPAYSSITVEYTTTDTWIGSIITDNTTTINSVTGNIVTGTTDIIVTDPDLVILNASITGTYTIDPSLAGAFNLTATGDCIISISSPPTGAVTKPIRLTIISNGFNVVFNFSVINYTGDRPIIDQTNNPNILLLVGLNGAWYVAPISQSHQQVTIPSTLNTIDLDKYGSNLFTITKTVGDEIITYIKSQSGILRLITFEAGITLVHSTGLILPNDGNDIITKEGDYCLIIGFENDPLGSMRVISYQRADGTALQGGGVTSLIATANQTTVSGATGDITIGTVQDINTTSSPTFDFLQNSITNNITAAGSNIGDAIQLTTQTNIITAGTPGTGVILTTGANGRDNLLFNNTIATIKIYATGATINGIAGATGVSIGAGQMAVFKYYLSSTAWVGYITTPSSTGTVESVTSGFSGFVDNTDAANPILNYVQPDWAQNSTSAVGYINNKPVGFRYWLESCRVLGNLDTMGAYVYNNGSSGVGGTIINADTQVALSIDGVAMTVGDSVLIVSNDFLGAIASGIYTVTDTGSPSTNWVLERREDFDTSAEMIQGATVLIMQGNTPANSGAIYYFTGSNPTVGTDGIYFSEIIARSTVSPSLYLPPCRLVSTENLVATYNNSLGTLTNNTTQGPLVIDQMVVHVNDSILVVGQSPLYQCGIYVCTDTGSPSTNWVLERREDFDTSAEILQGSRVAIMEGGTRAGSDWVMTTENPITVGTTSITFENFPLSVNNSKVLSSLFSDKSFVDTNVNGTYYIDPLNGNYQILQINNDVVLSMSAPTSSTTETQVINIVIRTDSVSAYDITWSGIAWDMGNPPIVDQSNQDYALIQLRGTGGFWYGCQLSVYNAIKNITAASTIDLDGFGSNLFALSGSSSISTITTTSGIERCIYITGTPTFVNGSDLILPTGTNIVARAGDIMKVMGYYGDTTTYCTDYVRGDGTPLGAVPQINTARVATTADLNAIAGSIGSDFILQSLTPYAAINIDGKALSVGDTVLVKNQDNPNEEENGLYFVSDIGSGSVPWILTRSRSYNTPAKIISGGLISIYDGVQNINKIFQLTTQGTIVVGTTDLIYAETSYLPQNINAQTGTTYTLQRSDQGKLITFNNSSAITVTAPEQATEITPKGYWCDYRNIGTGAVTFVTEGSETGTGNFIALAGASGKIQRDTPAATNWHFGGGSQGVNSSVNISIAAVDNSTYQLVLGVEAGAVYTILGFRAKSGSLVTAGDYTVKINGTNVTGLVNIANSTSISTATATAANTAVGGDNITITFASTVTLADFNGQLLITSYITNQ